MIYTLLSLIIIALGFTTFNLLRKLERYEEELELNQQFIDEELKRNEALLEALRQIDNRQMFEKDDDVGSIFSLIKETIERFKNLN
jgi:predicted Holliday junction resolvase-like endonuclease